MCALEMCCHASSGIPVLAAATGKSEQRNPALQPVPGKGAAQSAFLCGSRGCGTAAGAPAELLFPDLCTRGQSWIFYENVNSI